MDKKTILKVFGEAFLRSMVVLMAIVILGFSVFFIIKIRSDKKQLADRKTTEQGSTYSDDELQAMLDEENAGDTKEDATTEEVTTEEVTTEDIVEEIPSTDKKIVVLNSTSTTGLAGKWRTKLTSNGFANVGAGNYSAGAESQTKIYVTEDGMGQDLVSFFSGATVEIGKPDTNVCSVTQGNITLNDADIIIVVGNSDTSVQ